MRTPSVLSLRLIAIATLGLLLTPFTRAQQTSPQPTAAATAPLPAVNGYSPAYLASLRQRIAAHDPAIMPAFNKLVREADKALAMPPASVMDKAGCADSGDKHDYFSLAPYYWPDPTKPNGLPYIRKDGKTYPESKQGTDANIFPKVCASVELLGLAYYFTGNEAYAQKAAHLTAVWFLDPATRMNPNFNYAQAVRGQNSGRNAGVLEARHLATLTDGLALIATSPAWPAKAQNAIHAWIEAYYKWVTTSSNGKKEIAEPNNHGTWCNMHIAHLELYLGKTDAALARIEKDLIARIGYQITPDGKQPKELERTRSYHYSLYNLEALLLFAQLGDHANFPQGWTYTSKNGASLRAALAYVAAYLDKSKTWPHKDIEAELERDRVLPLLRAYLAHADAPELRALYNKYAPPQNKSDERWMLLLPEVK